MKNQEARNEEHDEELEQDIENDEEVAEEEAESTAEDEVAALKAENQNLRKIFSGHTPMLKTSRNAVRRKLKKITNMPYLPLPKNLLTVADNLHRALESIPEEKRGECSGLDTLLKGVELTENELMHVFEKNGIKKMEIMNTVFNPNFHQVVQEVEDSTKPAGTIIAELQTGYMINDRILREAMVVVTKGGK